MLGSMVVPGLAGAASVVPVLAASIGWVRREAEVTVGLGSGAQRDAQNSAEPPEGAQAKGAQGRENGTVRFGQLSISTCRGL